MLPPAAGVVLARCGHRRAVFGLDGAGAGAADPLAVDTEPTLDPLAECAHRIVICCDGTGNRSDDEGEGLPATTNVWKSTMA